MVRVMFRPKKVEILGGEESYIMGSFVIFLLILLF